MDEIAKSSIGELISIISSMVLEGRCIWSKKQTLFSVMDHLELEVKELREAILAAKSSSEVASEMGDVLSLSLILCFLAQREGLFPKDMPAEEAMKKLHRRAPFLFDGSFSSISHEEAERIWQEAKQQECSQPSSFDGNLS